MIALNPVCKFALSSKPLQSTLEFYLGVTSAADLPPDEAKLLGLEDDDDRGDEERGKLSDGEAEDEDADGTTTPRAVDSSSRFSLVAAPPKVKRGVRAILRVGLVAAITGIAIVFPDFQKVMGLVRRRRCAVTELIAFAARRRLLLHHLSPPAAAVLRQAQLAVDPLARVDAHRPRSADFDVHGRDGHGRHLPVLASAAANEESNACDTATSP